MSKITKQQTLIGLLSMGLVSFSQTAIAADRDKDPYLAGFERYAQENSELSGAIEAYKKDLQKVMEKYPELDESQGDKE